MRSSERWGPFPKWAAALLALGLLGVVVYELRGVLSPIALALGIAYLLDPLVDRFEARGVPRGAAITLVLLIVMAVTTGFLLLVLPGMVREVVHFATELPRELEELIARVEPWLLEHDIPVPHDLSEVLEQFEIKPGDLATHAAAPAQAVLQFVLGGTVSVIGAIASALIVPVLAFYLLYDFDRMTAAARDLVPPSIRPWVVEVASEIDQVLGQFVRGQLLVMMAMGVLYAVAYTLVDVRLAVPIGMIAGLLAFIPYVGSGSALAMGLLMCAVDWDGWTKPLLVVLAYGVCQTLEGFVIVPRVVGDKVGLPAVWVLVALMIGGEVFGFLGVLLAVPVAAVLKIFVVRGLRWYRQSPLYLEGAGVEKVVEVVRRTEASAELAPMPVIDAGPAAARASQPPPAPSPEPTGVLETVPETETESESESESVAAPSPPPSPEPVAEPAPEDGDAPPRDPGDETR